jgi:hypothetical protein
VGWTLDAADLFHRENTCRCNPLHEICRVIDLCDKLRESGKQRDQASEKERSRRFDQMTELLDTMHDMGVGETSKVG